MPSIPRSTFETLLPMIGAGLKIPHEYLRPSDSFDEHLNLKDRFWCLVIDDDSRHTIADEFDTQYNMELSCRWTDLRDVVLEASSALNTTVG